MRLVPGTHMTFPLPGSRPPSASGPPPGSGYVLRLNEIYGRSSRAIEGIVGYPAGLLSEGWYLLYLADKLAVDDYEMRGAAWLSDGVVQGHKLPKSVDRRPLQPERVLRTDHTYGPWSGDDVRAYKLKQVSTLQISGRQRLVKVRPALPSPNDPAAYLPGTALAQFWVVAGKRFWVQAKIGPASLTDGDWKVLASRWEAIVSRPYLVI